MCGALSCSFGAADKAPHWSAECSENQARPPPAVTLLRAACDGAVVGWGRWADGSTWLLWALVPAAAPALRACRLLGLWSAAGSCGAVAPAAWGDFGVGVNRGLILSREVNDLIWTPEALAYFDRYFLRFCCANPAVLWTKGVDAPGLRFYSFTSRESIRAQLIEVPLWRRSPASSSLDWGKQLRLSNCEPAQTYLWGCLHNSRYYVAEF